MAVKLGKKPPKADPKGRDFLLSSLLLPSSSLPPLPESWDWSKGVPSASLGMMLNDEIGDCTIAAAAHQVQVWTRAAHGVELRPPDSLILQAYEGASGYNPADPSTDQGAYELDVLNYWRKSGIGGYRIWGFAKVDHSLYDQICLAIYLFGGVQLGFSLPISAQGKLIWDVPSWGPAGDGAPGSWGGHEVCSAEFAPWGLTVFSWGGRITVTRAFIEAYCDEAHAPFSMTWIKGAQVAPNGLNVAALEAALRQIGQVNQ